MAIWQCHLGPRVPLLGELWLCVWDGAVCGSWHPCGTGCVPHLGASAHLLRLELFPTLLPALLQLLCQPGLILLGLSQAGLQLLTLLVQAVQLLQQGPLLGLQGLWWGG